MPDSSALSSAPDGGDDCPTCGFVEDACICPSDRDEVISGECMHGNPLGTGCTMCQSMTDYFDGAYGLPYDL